MAGKVFKKTVTKGKDVKSESKDDLDLRDEILYLKRELAAVRKDRDKLAIRLRKSDEESKRKDRQIDQLMDPSQNSEIRELLSMKGAAMLMNLKDQNNSLIHMIMEKNQQIKRMASEIKTAKLYSKTSKNEPYRMEIVRLRNLLLKSQEALKEAAHGPQMACVSGHSRSSYSSSEGAPSNQELDELRFMVQSLETHMQYSKELLTKKNQEIATLSRELESVLESEFCQSIVSPHWKVGHGHIQLENDKARRCASAPGLERFQQDGLKSSRLALDEIRESFQQSARQVSSLNFLQREIHENSTGTDVNDKKRETILKSGIITNDLLGDGFENSKGFLGNQPGKCSEKSLKFREMQHQVDFDNVIRAKKELGKLEDLSKTLKRDSTGKRSKKSLALTDKSGNRTLEKRRPTAREKWKCAFYKVHTSRKIPKKVRKSGGGKLERKFHTNPHANDDEVWTIIKRGNFDKEENAGEMENCLGETSVTNVALPADDSLGNVNISAEASLENSENGKPDPNSRNVVNETRSIATDILDENCLPRQNASLSDNKENEYLSNSRVSAEEGGASLIGYKLRKSVSNENQQRPQPKARKFSLPAKLAHRNSERVMGNMSATSERELESSETAESPLIPLDTSEFNKSLYEVTTHEPRFSMDSSLDSFEPVKSFQVVAEINSSTVNGNKNEMISDNTESAYKFFDQNSVTDDDDDDDVITI